MGGGREGGREREREREIRQSAHGTEKWVEKREKKNKIERRNGNRKYLIKNNLCITNGSIKKTFHCGLN